MGVGRVKAAAIVATSRTVKRAKLAADTFVAPPTTPNSLVSAWSLAIEPGMLIAVVPRNLGRVSERAISSAMVEMAFAARSGRSRREGGGKREGGVHGKEGAGWGEGVHYNLKNGTCGLGTLLKSSGLGTRSAPLTRKTSNFPLWKEVFKA